LPAQFSDAVQPAVIKNVPPPDPVLVSPYTSVTGSRPAQTAEPARADPLSPATAPAAPGPGYPYLAAGVPEFIAAPAPNPGNVVTPAPYPGNVVTPTPKPGNIAPNATAPLGSVVYPQGDPCADLLCPLPDATSPLFYQNRLRLSAEYLMWWTSGFHAPPLVTTGPGTSDGIIGQPGVTTLAGDERVSPTFRSGARFGFDWMFSRCGVWGVDGHYFFLGTNVSNETFTSNQDPSLARPFFNVNQHIPFSEVVASPGLLTGLVNIHTSTALWGADINLKRRLFDGDNWTLGAFGGYRYLSLTEDLTITERAFAAPGAAATGLIPANFVSASAFDTFHTTNQFNGGQVGMYFEGNVGRWVFTVRPSIAMGVTSSTLGIAGGETTNLTTGSTSASSGLLALNSNSGHYTKNTFAVVPEGTFNIGYNVSPHLRLFVGYNVLYWSSVLRPGAQVNPNLDINRIPGFPATAPAASVQPTPSLRDQTFWAQGVNFGLMFRW